MKKNKSSRALVLAAAGLAVFFCHRLVRKKREKDDSFHTLLSLPDGTVAVDGYLIPARKANAYVAAREKCALAAAELMYSFCSRVTREGAGTRDGESVVGYKGDGGALCTIHLNPGNVREMMNA
ncbi:MAG: hypothetical protein RSE36_06315, partial [Oscillospiraceae bacterium]